VAAFKNIERLFLQQNLLIMRQIVRQP
jgi:hypothetical protein